MGYLENCLPQFFASLGVEVHIVTSNLPPYYQLTDFNETYGTFTKRVNNHDSVETYNGVTLHVLPFKRVFGYIRLVGLAAKLRQIKPDIVQTTAAIGWIPLDVAIAKLFIGYKLFTGNHNAASTFPLAQRKVKSWDKEMIRCFLTRTIPGRLASLFTEKCYAVTVDCADIAVRFFGVQKKKVVIMHLGVDPGVFFPVISDQEADERIKVRSQLGIKPSDIVCIYTGKLTAEKNALLLAQAVARLSTMGEPFHGLFIGEGTQRDAIQSYPSCTVLPFMPFPDLAPFYRSSDIGVWPTNESTSTLDAAACGLPLIVSDGIVYREHVDGNGLVYKINDLDDLVNSLLKLRNPLERQRLGTCGAQKMAEQFSWALVARHRLRDYEAALGIGKS